jgi:hypothetical protein
MACPRVLLLRGNYETGGSVKKPDVGLHRDPTSIKCAAARVVVYPQSAVGIAISVSCSVPLKRMIELLSLPCRSMPRIILHVSFA